MLTKFKRLMACFMAAVICISMFGTLTLSAATIKNGSRGTEVKYLQLNLNGLGYDCGKADGIAGKNTVAAIKDFQADYGLSVDGMAGTQTQSKIKSIIKEIQSNLNTLGYSAGSADGIFGKNTAKALKSFQRDYGLSVTGVADMYTIYLLSQTVYDIQNTVYTVEFMTHNACLMPVYSEMGKATIPADLSPERSGYYFCGWATSKYASEPEYIPGDTITVTDDMTLYAVWGDKDDMIDALDMVKGFKQVKNYCTSSAAAVMMARRQFLDGHGVSFNYFDIRMSFGLTRAEAENGKSASATWTQEEGFSNGYSGKGDITFHMGFYSKTDLGNDVDARREKIIQLLSDHPEGIVLYCKNSLSKHAVVLTEYIEETKTFMCYDSQTILERMNAGDGDESGLPVRLQDTYLYRAYGKSVDKLFGSNLIEVWTIKSANY